MLFAVEGGGFFSSSASGYSKGLTLLLLGQKNEEKPMRVTPWNHYQLVDQETNPDLQLASGKERLVQGCASFVCFRRAAAGLESPSPLKVGPAQNQEILPRPTGFVESKDQRRSADHDDDNSDGKVFSLKSSLKKAADNSPTTVAATGGDVDANSNEHETLCEKNNDVPCQIDRRKVQWTDAIGGELFEVREFEMSEGESDDELDHGNEKACSCTIM